jgi:hypothetical protein
MEAKSTQPEQTSLRAPRSNPPIEVASDFQAAISRLDATLKAESEYVESFQL